MKGTSAAMILELSGSSRLAHCWKITSTLGTVLTYTDHDEPIVDPTDGLTYEPLAGGSQSDILSDVSLSADNVEVHGAMVSPAPTMDTVRAGDWDYASIELFYLCWFDPSKGRHLLRSGNVGELSTKLSDFSGEFRGLLQSLSTSIGSVTQPGCRNRFGDYHCNLNGTTAPDDFKADVVITSVSADGTVITFNVAGGSPAAGSPTYYAGSPSEANPYAFGKITVTSGLNVGRTCEVKSSTFSQVILHLPFPYTLSAGDTATVYEGCDGKRETCVNRFNNVNNFNGEPFAPGTDKAIQVARSS